MKPLSIFTIIFVASLFAGAAIIYTVPHKAPVQPPLPIPTVMCSAPAVSDFDSTKSLIDTVVDNR